MNNRLEDDIEITSKWFDHWLLRYGFAVVLVALATWGYYLLIESLGMQLTYILYSPAVIITAVVAGFGPGVVATLLSAACADYFFLLPAGQFKFNNEADTLGLMIFLLVSLSICLLVKSMNQIRKQTEQKLRTANIYNRSLIEASLDPLVTINAEGKITDVNTATELVTGRNRGHLIGSDFTNYFTDPEQAREAYQKVFSQGILTNHPLAIQHASGGITDVLYNATVYHNNKGKILGVFAAARDITKLKHIEAQLAESESRLRAIIDNEPECIKIVDTEGSLVQMNPAGLKMIEADSQEQVVGCSVFELIAPEYRNAYTELHKRVLAGDAVQMEYEIIGLKGGRRWLESHAVPMQEANGNVVHLAVTRDITDRKRAELALNQLNETLEQRVQEETEKNSQKEHLLIQQSRLAAMGEMIGNIAHQWRQPLNALTLVLANIEDAAKHQELTPEYLENQTRNGERLIQKMSSTIDDFRHFFRPQKEVEPFSAIAAIEEARSLASASFHNNNIELRLEMREDVQIVGFANEFSQVLLNLLSNAKDAILSRHIQNGMVTIRLSSNELSATIEVIDNGGGIPASAMEHIFEPYFSTKEMGTGIGLYMSKMIIETSMHGSILVRNEDSGTAFSIVCPHINATC
jgi:PAS domain S-box-containing protein